MELYSQPDESKAPFRDVPLFCSTKPNPTASCVTNDGGRVMTGNALGLIRSALRDNTQHSETHKKTLRGGLQRSGATDVATESTQMGSRLHQRSSLAGTVLFSDSSGSNCHHNLVINQLLAGSGL